MAWRPCVLASGRLANQHPESPVTDTSNTSWTGKSGLKNKAGASSLHQRRASIADAYNCQVWYIITVGFKLSKRCRDKQTRPQACILGALWAHAKSCNHKAQGRCSASCIQGHLLRNRSLSSGTCCKEKLRGRQHCKSAFELVAITRTQGCTMTTANSYWQQLRSRWPLKSQLLASLGAGHAHCAQRCSSSSFV